MWPSRCPGGTDSLSLPSSMWKKSRLSCSTCSRRFMLKCAYDSPGAPVISEVFDIEMHANLACTDCRHLSSLRSAWHTGYRAAGQAGPASAWRAGLTGRGQVGAIGAAGRLAGQQRLGGQRKVHGAALAGHLDKDHLAAGVLGHGLQRGGVRPRCPAGAGARAWGLPGPAAR